MSIHLTSLQTAKMAYPDSTDKIAMILHARDCAPDIKTYLALTDEYVAALRSQYAATEHLIDPET